MVDGQRTKMVIGKNPCHRFSPLLAPKTVLKGTKNERNDERKQKNARVLLSANDISVNLC